MFYDSEECSQCPDQLLTVKRSGISAAAPSPTRTVEHRDLFRIEVDQKHIIGGPLKPPIRGTYDSIKRGVHGSDIISVLQQVRVITRPYIPSNLYQVLNWRDPFCTSCAKLPSVPVTRSP